MTTDIQVPALGRGARLIQFWVRCYTAGLPDPLRADRRDEISSDLWEHSHDHAADRSAFGAEIVTRGLLGAPADLIWRVERSRLARLPGGATSALLAVLGQLESTGRWLERRGLPGLGSAVAVVVALLGVLVIVTARGNNSGTPAADLVWWGSLLLLAAAVLGVGSRSIGQHPRIGGVLVLLGSGLMGLLLWPTVIAPIVAIGLAWRAIVRIRSARIQRAKSRPVD